MTDFVEFGDPARFALALRWAHDCEPRAQRPAKHGWSMGDLQITIGGTAVTSHTWSAGPSSARRYVGWYLSPLIEWLAFNWVHLFHEEDFSWREPTGIPAAVACRKALHKWIDAGDHAGRQTFAATQDWYHRHGLRTAAEGGLFPDLFIRRLIDDAELSWTSTPPIFAPGGFVFTAPSAQATLPIEDVAAPLWKALRWFAAEPPRYLDAEDKRSWNEIVRKIDDLDHLSIRDLQAPYLPRGANDWLSAHADLMSPEVATSIRADDAPVLVELAATVAMFGGVSPNLSENDAEALVRLLNSRKGAESEYLISLVETRGLSPLGVPHHDGYDFAELLLDDLGLLGNALKIDIEQILARLGISIDRHEFDSRDIRGVALAGKYIAPRIIINTESIYNDSTEGQRFTLAHELCHILHDRSRARRVTHVSGPWVAQGFERRANAFAAYFLMPRPLVLLHLGPRPAGQAESVRHVAKELGVSQSALVEHLFNLQLITDWEREDLRRQFRSIH